MRKLLCCLLLGSCLFLIGCGSQQEKKCRIEIVSAETLDVIKTLEEMEQKELETLLDMEHWEETAEPDETLMPEYEIIVYQEKTPTTISAGDTEDNYEKIAAYVTYENSRLVKEVIDGDVIKSGKIPEDLLTVYYETSETFTEHFEKMVTTDNQE